LADSHQTLAELLAPHGFHTAAIVGALVLEKRFGLAQGFALYDDGFDDSRRKDSHSYIERSAEEVTERALLYLRERADEPFFLFLHYFDPHRDWVAPPEFARRFPGDLYAAEIAYTDEQVGRVLTALRELGLEESTLVVLTADHGESLGDFDEISHAYFIYQVTQSIPLIVHAPGMQRRRDVEPVIGLVDVVPTVLALLGLEIPQHLQGRDLSPLWKKPRTPPEERVLFAESLTPTKLDCNPLFAAVSDRWKYIHTRRPELYDLANDPQERNDLADREPLVASRMREALERIFADRADSGASRFEVDEATRIGLEALGYLGAHVDDRLEIDPDLDDPKDCIGLFNAFASLIAHSQEGDWAAAREAARLLLARRPDLADVYRYLGQIASEEERWSEAVSHLRLYLALIEAEDPPPSGLPVLGIGTRRQRAEAYNSLGVARAQLGNLEEALSDFRRAAEINPRFIKAHFNTGYTLIRMGREPEALAPLRRTLELDPAHEKAHRHLERLEGQPESPGEEEGV
jgi:arylsulfatase A-like enzyme